MGGIPPDPLAHFACYSTSRHINCHHFKHPPFYVRILDSPLSPPIQIHLLTPLSYYQFLALMELLLQLINNTSHGGSVKRVRLGSYTAS